MPARGRAIVGFLNLSELIRGKLQQAFGPLGLHRVEADIQPGNAASIALARRAGFEKEGFLPEFLMIEGAWRDHERSPSASGGRRATSPEGTPRLAGGSPR